MVNIDAKDYFLPALGYVVKLHDVKNYLFKQIKKASGVKLCYHDKVIDFERTIEHVSVKLISDKVLTGDLLVAADGIYSMIGKNSTIEWQKESLTSIVCSG